MQLALFEYTDPGEQQINEIRTVEIDGEIWFVAGEVCRILDIKNVSDALSRLDNDEKLTSVIPMSGQNRNVYLVSESGLYALIFKSRKPTAQQFRKWIPKHAEEYFKKRDPHALDYLPKILGSKGQMKLLE